MTNIDSIESWKSSFGLLPIHLNQAVFDSKFIMLNGGVGDFCLQFGNDDLGIESIYSNSWSSGTKNYLIVDNDNLSICNWASSKVERIPKQIASNNFSKLYDYIHKKSNVTTYPPLWNR